MIVTVSSKGQVVIPAEIRRKFGLRKGIKLRIISEENKIILEPVERQLEKDFGILKGGRELLEELLRERKRESEREEVRVR